MKLLARIKKRRLADNVHKTWYKHDLMFVGNMELPELDGQEISSIKSVWPCLEWRREDFLMYRALKKLGMFSPYFVGGYQSSFIWKALNPREWSVSLSNKAYMDYIYPQIPFPKTYIRGITGNVYDAEMHFLTKKEAIDRLIGLQDFIVKPSVERSYGDGVCKITVPADRDEANAAIQEVLDNAGSNYVVQEVLKQHPVMSGLNPTSVNSCRFTSIYIDGRYSVSIGLRIGKLGSHIDNWRKGYFVGVSSDGVIDDVGYDIALNEVRETDTHVAFGGIKIPGFDKMATLVEYAHKKYFPMCGVIGWDVMVDAEEMPHVIEFNLRPDFFAEQLASGAFFEPFSSVICKKILE